MFPHYSRSTADHDAAHSVGETVREQTGDVIVHDLHLTALELSDLIKADLVLLGVLEDVWERQREKMKKSSNK